MKLCHDEIEVEVVVHSDLQILVVLEVATDYFLDCSKKDLDDFSNQDRKCFHRLGFEAL